MLAVAIMVLTMLPQVAFADETQRDEWVQVIDDSTNNVIGEYDNINAAIMGTMNSEEAPANYTIKLLGNYTEKCGEYYKENGYEDSFDGMLFQGFTDLVGILIMGNITFDLNGYELTIEASNTIAGTITTPGAEYMSNKSGWAFVSMNHFNDGEFVFKNGTIKLDDNVVGITNYHGEYLFENVDITTIDSDDRAYAVAGTINDVDLRNSSIATGGAGYTFLTDEEQGNSISMDGTSWIDIEVSESDTAYNISYFDGTKDINSDTTVLDENGHYVPAPEGYVAKVNGKYYETVSAAIAASGEDDTILLVADASHENIIIDGDKNIKINNVNGFTIPKISAGEGVEISYGEDGSTIIISATTSGDSENPEGTTSRPGGSQDGNGNKVPETGDVTNLALLFGIMALATAVATGTVIYGRKRKA